MPTTVSQSTLDKVARILNEACDDGDNVSAIAERANVNRDMVSGLRNGRYTSSPTIDKLEALMSALGYELDVRKSKG